MKHVSIFLRLLAIATICTLGACQKQPVSNNESNTVVVSSRTAQPGQLITARLSTAQYAQLSQSGTVAISKDAIETGRGVSATLNAGVGIAPGGCQPISQATLNYWQQQANECCCDIIVCLQDQTCAYVMMLFRPSVNSGCNGGGGQYM
jgi:hypothetical protein